ncbi:MAG: HAD family hydrolase [Balneolaceae bacterium]|nr:MAG: HAD family hydrolase [Balneolaceae bacterium]
MFDDIDTILWDFDGVILDSVQIRNEGYWHVLKEYPKEEVQKLIHYQNENGGLSRYVKFRYFYEQILGMEISEEKVQEFAGQFSDYMRKTLTDPKRLISETVEFIRAGQGIYSMHVVSGSDQAELRFLCRELKIDTFFRSILGSPTPKIDLVKSILEEEKYNPGRVVLIGDSINDFEAADVNNILFYGYNNPSLKTKGEGYIERSAFFFPKQ